MEKAALVAVGHTILVDIWHMISNQTEYHDLGADYFTTRIDRRRHTQHLISQLRHLGYAVQLNPEQNGQTATLTR